MRHALKVWKSSGALHRAVAGRNDYHTLLTWMQICRF